jgi:hypothetical protein
MPGFYDLWSFTGYWTYAAKTKIASVISAYPNNPAALRATRAQAK